MVFSNVCDDSVKKRKQLIENAANDAFLLAFTDWDELVKWSTEKEETLICTYDDLKTMVLNDPDQIKGFVINPFGQNVVITPELIHYIAQRTSEIVIEKDTQILLGQPAEYPQEMVNALSVFFREEKPEVESAYLFLAHKEGDEKPNLLLIIDFKGEQSSVFPQIAAVANRYLAEDEYIDLVAFDCDFGRDATKDATPFYRRDNRS
ncbi:MAG TPA: enhanced serine sensitivity protein SseB C-terminal domain-containing protein [Bacillota bacterium]|nr:enhanced serine sensitivity protein SseB C-terminal domain-containing protein [Bacillota bacterium]